MKSVIGVDGCRTGWIAVGYAEDSSCEARVFPDVESLHAWAGPQATVLMDIPIGLIDSGPDGRECDTLARKLLRGARASSVFTPPCRPALEAESWSEALEINRSCTGKGLSIQAWAIAPKIREVDAYLRRDPQRQQQVREVHPEVLFWALSGRNPMRHNKKRSAGREERLAVLAAHWPDVRAVFRREWERIRGQGAAADDLLDALASVAAWRVCGGRFATLPESPSRDAAGLRMEMLYPPTVSAESQPRQVVTARAEAGKLRVSYDRERDVLLVDLKDRESIGHAGQTGSIILHRNDKGDPTLLEIRQASAVLALVLKSSPQPDAESSPQEADRPLPAGPR